MAIKQFGSKLSRFLGEAMANPVQEIVIISTNESDSDNKDEVVV